MNTTELASVILAGIAILGVITSVTALTFRVGRLIGVSETLINQGNADRVQLRAEIVHVASQIDRHEQWHMGPAPLAPGKVAP